MNDRLSRWVAALLAHRAGFVTFNVFTFIWFGAPALVGFYHGWHLALVLELVFFLPGYLDIVTWFSGATQFTLAYQNQRAQSALDLSLRNMTDMMKLDIVLAEKVNQALERLEEATDKIDARGDTLLDLTKAAVEIQKIMLAHDEEIAADVEELQSAVTSRLALSRKLSVPIKDLLAKEIKRDEGRNHD